MNPTLLKRFSANRLYAITTDPLSGKSNDHSFDSVKHAYEQMVESACRGGVRLLQYREKKRTKLEQFQIACSLRAICRTYETLFIVNDDLALALACDADGVHLGQDDLPLAQARALRDKIKPDFLIGYSTHSFEQAKAAVEAKADYIGIGPVFATPTKPTYGSVGLELVKEVTSAFQIPHVAIGGIDLSNVDSVFKAGAQRVAVVRAVCGASDVEAAAKKFIEKIQQH